MFTCSGNSIKTQKSVLQAMKTTVAPCSWGIFPCSYRPSAALTRCCLPVMVNYVLYTGRNALVEVLRSVHEMNRTSDVVRLIKPLIKTWTGFSSFTSLQLWQTMNIFRRLLPSSEKGDDGKDHSHSSETEKRPQTDLWSNRSDSDSWFGLNSSHESSVLQSYCWPLVNSELHSEANVKPLITSHAKLIRG